MMSNVISYGMLTIDNNFGFLIGLTCDRDRPQVCRENYLNFLDYLFGIEINIGLDNKPLFVMYCRFFCWL